MMWTDQVQWAALDATQGSRDAAVVDGEHAVALARRRRARRARRPRARAPEDDPRRRAPRRVVERARCASSATRRRDERQMLTWDEVRRTMKLTTYGGHSHTHPIMSRLDRRRRRARDRARARIASPPRPAARRRTFAYPNGRRTDYTPETQRDPAAPRLRHRLLDERGHRRRRQRLDGRQAPPRRSGQGSTRVRLAGRRHGRRPVAVAGAASAGLAPVASAATTPQCASRGLRGRAASGRRGRCRRCAAARARRCGG